MTRGGQLHNTLCKTYHFFWITLDWIYPPYCVGCGVFGTRWCETCQSDVQVIGKNCCNVCGDVLPGGGVCTQCGSEQPPFTALRSFGIHQGPLKKAIHSLKYQSNIALGDVFYRPMSKYLSDLGWDIDLVIPVPLNRIRLKERGYNQAALLAFPISLDHRKHYSPNAIVRIKNTKTQIGLSRHERTENVQSAFQADPKKVNGRKILLIDDVATSGATMRETAKATLEAGALIVYGLTLSRAVFSQNDSSTKSGSTGFIKPI